MAQHRATVTIEAPTDQVYALFTHFNDYPKFMTYVQEVTYIDDKRSHWVVDVVGRHEWDAINEDWIEDRQIGWRSTSGTANSGRISFEPLGKYGTRVTADITYDPPAGLLGAIGEALGGGSLFESRLQHDLEHFARMVAEAPSGALDPTSSAYLFHRDSAVAKGATTPAQDRTMGLISADPARPVPELSDPAIPNIPGTSQNSPF